MTTPSQTTVTPSSRSRGEASAENQRVAPLTMARPVQWKGAWLVKARALRARTSATSSGWTEWKMASGSARTESLSALSMARRPLLTKVKAAQPSGFRSSTKVPTGMRSIISKTTCSWLRAEVAEAEEGSPCMGRGAGKVAGSGGLTGHGFEVGADVDAGCLDEVCAGDAEFCADVASVGVDGEGGDA